MYNTRKQALIEKVECMKAIMEDITLVIETKNNEAFKNMYKPVLDKKKDLEHAIVNELYIETKEQMNSFYTFLTKTDHCFEQLLKGKTENDILEILINKMRARCERNKSKNKE